MYRFLVRVQFLLLVVIYSLIGYKLWTKTYDPRFCTDFMIFNRISFFWFFHLVIAGIFLVTLYIFLKKIDSKSIIFIEIIIIASFGLFLVFAEGYFRLRPEALPLEVLKELGYKEGDKVYKNKLQFTLADKHNDDPELVIISKPNLSFFLKAPEFSYLFRTDSFGFQNFNDETLYNNADIVTLGDSFTEGACASFEFSYPNQLAKLLSIRVLNLGQGSYDCYHFPIVLRRFGLQAHPKIVVMSIFSWNDIHPRYHVWKEYCLSNGFISFQDFNILQAKWEQYRLNKGHIPLNDFTVSMAEKIKINENQSKNRSFYMSTYLKYLSEWIKELFAKYQALWNYGNYRGIRINGKWIRCRIKDPICYGSDSGEVLERCLRYLNETITEFKYLSKKYHFQPIILYFPSKEEVYTYFFKDFSHRKKCDMDKIVINRIKDLGVEVVDMTPFFVDSINNGVMPYHIVDDHLNKEGYRVTAVALANYLKNSGAIKK